MQPAPTKTGATIPHNAAHRQQSPGIGLPSQGYTTDMTDSTAPANQDPRKDSLIEYPSSFPIKVMGIKTDGFVHAITQVAEQFDPTFDASTVELRPSSSGKYLGVTITITATSRAQLDSLYQALSSHPMVKVVL